MLDLILAAVATVAFWLTIGQPDNVTPQEQDMQNPTWKYSVGFAPDVVEQAMSMPPGRLLTQGKVEESVREAIQLAADKPHDVMVNLCAGNVLSQVGNKDEGFRLLKKAVALAPRSRYIRLNLAEKFASDKRYDEAVNQYRLIIAGYPHWSKPHLDLAEIYLATEQPQLEAEELKIVLEQDPTNGTLRKQRALALTRTGLDKEGLEEYVRGNADELNFLGLPADVKQAAENWGSINRAEYECRRELESDPDSTTTKLRLARILIYRGQTVAAKTLLTEAARKAPNNPDVHRNLALVLQKLGDSNAALAEFRRSVNLEQAARAHQG